MGLGDIVRGTREQLRPEPVPTIPIEGRRVLLVYLFGGLGDVALLAPVIAALLAAKAARVGVVVPEGAGRLLARSGLPHVRHAPEASLPRYDVAVDLTHRGGVDSRRHLACAPVRLGFVTEPDPTLAYGARDVRPFADRHWSRALMGPLAPLGLTEPDYRVPWDTTPVAARWARSRWTRGKRRVLLVPGGRSQEKQWDGWGRVLPALDGAEALVLGAPWEAAALRSLGLGRAYTGRDLAKLMALVRHAELVLASDTGPMHLAFACERPTVALFRRMAPESWGPPRPDPRFAVTRSPEGLDPSEWVIREARRLLAR